jgi:DtxR family Mn-dependent transcriptional regulator
MSSELSAKMRDYLAKVYALSETTAAANGYVSTSALADLIDVSAPAVNRMVTKLKELGLLHHEPYQGIVLTETGTREALVKLRYQRIAAAFLADVMGFGWHEIYEEANQMSGALSETIAQRMLDMAGNPTHDPFGEPIPDINGIIVDPDDGLMTETEDNQQVTITRVKTREPDRLEYIAALGLMPGVTLHLLHKAPFNGPIQLKLGEEYRIIGHNLAELIRVKTG